MFRPAFEVKARMEQMMRDPAAALRQGLASFPEKIIKKQEAIDELKRQLNAPPHPELVKLRQEVKPGGFIDRIGNWLQKVGAIKPEDIQRAETQLQHLKDKFQELSTPFNPTGKIWTFNEIEDEISRLYEQLAGSYTSLTITLAPSFEAHNQAAATQSEEAQLQAALALISIPPPEDIDILLLGICKLTIELQKLYRQRQQLLPSFEQEIATWDPHKLNAEIHKRKRDLDDLLSDFNDLFGGTRGKADSFAKIMKASPLLAVLREQHRFSQNIIVELETALQRQAQPPPPNQSSAAAAKIARLQALMKERDDLKAKSPQALHADIDRVYGQMIDDERKKP